MSNTPTASAASSTSAASSASTASPVQTLPAAWQQLVTLAVLGTDRAGRTLPTLDGRQGTLLAGIAADPERQMLASAGVAAASLDAGRCASKATGGAVEPCPPDAVPVCSERAGTLLRKVLRDYPDALLGEWCAAAATANRRVPEPMLVRLLDTVANTKDSELGELALQVSGERGRWLARRNPRWRAGAAPPTADPTETWQSGTRDERLALIVSLRRSDPAKARDLVAGTWADEPAEMREPIVRLFAAGLSMADEPFLEAALDDKRKAVRTHASAMLATLPTSRLCQRMAVRLADAVKLEQTKSSILRRMQKLLVVTLPGDPDKPMLRDGLEAKARGKLGPKAVLLQGIVAATPLSTYAAWDTPPSELTALAAETEWKEALIQGWALAAARQADGVWAAALLTDQDFRRTPADRLAIDLTEVVPGLTGCLAPADRERVATAWLADLADPFNDAVFVAALAACTHAWSASFTAAILKALQKRFNVAQAVYCGYSPRLCDLFALRMDPQAAAAALAVPVVAEALPWYRSFIDKLLDMLSVRRDYLKEFRS